MLLMLLMLIVCDASTFFAISFDAFVMPRDFSFSVFSPSRR